jgi:thioester reductase-like protein/NADP-dependent 3-hydroxy acid dehydrogenase YdfG
MITYLVTGATGLIGGQVTRRLLECDDTARVLVLVRESSKLRLERAFEGWGNVSKVEPLIGDISQPRLGLDDDAVEALRGAVDHVVHLAALYDITADDETSVRANVDGTRHVIELAGEIGAGCLHHTSSVAVAGEYRGTFTEEMFDEGQRLPTAYHRTKFESERLVREQTVVPWRVYRPAVVVGDSVTGEMDKLDGPYYLFPTIARLAALPPVPLVAPNVGDTNIVPVDYVAAAMVYLINKPGLDGRAFFLINPKPQSTTEVYNAFARVAGAPMIAASWPRQLSAPLLRLVKLSEQIPGALLVRDAVMHRVAIPPQMLDVAVFVPTFDATATRAELAGSGIKAPRLASYAEPIWTYWEQHLDPFRARRHGPRGALDGRRVVITGASSGIGRATALKVAARGGIPLLVARRAAELDAVREEIRATGGAAFSYPCDLTDGESVHKTVRQMVDDHGGVDMLVNNAGRSIRRSVTLSYDRFHDYERAMAINYFGSVRLILELLPHMIEQKFGHIVNVSSIGVQGIAPRFSAYVASKAALDYFSKVAATETHGEGVTFTTVHMPLVRTPMIAPTKLYDAFPTKSPEQAADMVINALVRRPKHIGTPTGAVMGVTYSLAPGLVDAIANQAYRIFPDSVAAGGDGVAGNGVRFGPRDRQITRAATTLAKLTRGFHW